MWNTFKHSSRASRVSPLAGNLFGIGILACFAGLAYAPAASSHEDTLERIEEVTGEMLEHPEDAQPLFERGRLYLDLQNYSQAVTDFDQALERDRSKLEVLIYRAKALDGSGNSAQALKDLDQYVAHGPASYLAFAARAQVRTHLNDREGAVEDLREAIKLNPQPEDFVQRARLLKALGRDAEAISSYEEGIDRLGAPVPLVLELSDALAANGRTDDALQRLGQLERESPRPEAWILKRADILQAAGRVQEAQLACRDALERIDARVAEGRVTQMLLLQRAQALAGSGRADEARQVFDALGPAAKELQDYRQLAQRLGR